MQGASLAQMDSTPVAVARSYGAGRVVVMDAGLAVDRTEAQAGKKAGPVVYGIELQQNQDFVLRCVEWLLNSE